MGPQGSRVRVAVTGASGYIGSGLVRHLEGQAQVEKIVAIDVRPPTRSFGARTHFVRRDVAEPLGDLLSHHEVEVVVHLAFVLRPGRDRDAVRRVNVGGTRNVLEACKRAGVKKVVYLSSATAYGAHPNNPPMLAEESPLRPVRGHQYGEDKAEAEAFLLKFAEACPEVTATVLRGCPVLGPNADNFVSRSLSQPFLFAVAGHNPLMQLVHEDDMTEVLARCTLNETPGMYNVAGDEPVTWREMAAVLGQRLVTLPARLLYWATEVGWRLRLQSTSPSSGLDLIRYPWTVSTEKIKRDLGVTFRYSTRKTLESFLRRG